MKDVETAKSILTGSECTIVLCKGDAVISSTKRGIVPMVEILSNGEDVTGFSVADKIVGKAAALLFVLAGIKEVFAEVISKNALTILEQNGIPVTYNVLTDVIINRTNTGPCPMECAVKDVTSPEDALEAVKSTLNRLKSEEK